MDFVRPTSPLSDRSTLTLSPLRRIGQLDDREITTSLGKRLLMVLSPFVFLHTSPYTPIPELQEDEVASAHWIPLELLHPPASKYGSVEIDIATRLAPRSKVARSVLQLLMGKMDFKYAVPLLLPAFSHVLIVFRRKQVHPPPERPCRNGRPPRDTTR